MNDDAVAKKLRKNGTTVSAVVGEVRRRGEQSHVDIDPLADRFFSTPTKKKKSGFLDFVRKHPRATLIGAGALMLSMVVLSECSGEGTSQQSPPPPSTSVEGGAVTITTELQLTPDENPLAPPAPQETLVPQTTVATPDSTVTSQSDPPTLEQIFSD